MPSTIAEDTTRHSFKTGLSVLLLGLLLITTLLVMQLVFVHLGTQRAVTELEKEAELLAHSLENSVTRTVQGVQGRLRSLEDLLRHNETLLQQPLELQQRMQMLVAMTPQLRELAVLTQSAGQLSVLASSAIARDGSLVEPLSCSQGVPVPSLLRFSEPLKGRFLGSGVSPAGVYKLPVCMLFLSEGEQAYWLVAVLNPDSIRELFWPIIDNLPAEIHLYRHDGHSLVVLPEKTAASAAEPALLDQVRQQEWGLYSGAQGDTEWVTAYRATSMFPLLLTLSIDRNQALAPWYKTVTTMWLIVGVVMLLILLASTLIAWMRYRQYRLLDELQLLGAAISTTANAVLITDSCGVIRWVNQAFTRLTGYQPEEALGNTPAILNSGEHTSLFFKRLWDTISVGDVWRGEVINRTRDGQQLMVEQTITPIKNDAGVLTHFVAVHEDITARKAAEQRSLYLANHDHLTGLPNRRELLTRLGQWMQPTGPDYLALLFIDLDNFKAVNDTLGHGRGDELLVGMVARLKNLVPEGGCLARPGGGEFAIGMRRDVSREHAAALAKRITDLLAESFELTDHTFTLTASIGVALAAKGKGDPVSLLRQADLALYAAKHDGRSTYRLFNEEMDFHVARRVNLEQGLRTGLKHPERVFSMHYQPVFDAQTLKPVAAELLLRWKTESNEWISPAEFIPVAEESGVIIELGRWQLAQVVARLADWTCATESFYLSINVSAIQLARDDIAECLIGLLDQYGIAPHRITVEVTETAIISINERFETNLACLAAAGVRLSIDDFGTGYSSLGNLRNLRADYLKIDRSFVVGIGQNRGDEEIILAMLALARSLNMKVVAEGVDKEHQLRFLQHAGCDQIQGYLLAKPMPEAALMRHLQQHQACRVG